MNDKDLENFDKIFNTKGQGQLDNLLIITISVCLWYPSKERRILYAISLEASITYITFNSSIDIAIYYSLCAMVSALVAYYSMEVIRSDSASVYGSIMLCQGLFCIALVFDGGMQYNNLIQYELTYFNDKLYIIISLIGIVGSDSIPKRFLSCDNIDCTGVDNGRGGNHNRN